MSRALSVLIILASCPTLWAERRIALIVDTSGSMNQNDRPRYAVQISKILSDLTEDRDRVAIIKLTQELNVRIRDLRDLRDLLTRKGGQDCNAPADPSSVAELAGSQRSLFKAKIDQLLQYQGPTPFGPPLRSAIPFLGESRGVQRLLLLISDAQEGFGNCSAEYTQMLQRLGETGATVALIKMGGHQDDFQGNPAIQFREDVLDSRKLIGAVAHVYQRFLGSKNVQTGPVSGNISVEISEHVKEAFLVVAADSALGQLSGPPGNPHSDKIDFDYRSGGDTVGVDNVDRGYRIIRLTNASAGHYTFSAPPGTTGGWMLIEDYALALRLVSQTPVPADSSSTIQLEVVDERTGKRVTDNQTLNKLIIGVKLGSSIVTLTNNGSGVFTTEHKFDAPGVVPLQAKLTGGNINRTFDLSITVDKAAPVKTGKVEPQTPNQGTVNSPVPVQVKWSGNGTPPDRVIATIDGKKVELTDKTASGMYSGSWTPNAPGPKKIHYEGEGGTSVTPVDSDITVADKQAATPPLTPPATPPSTTTLPPPPPSPPPPKLASPGELNLGRSENVTIGRLTAGEDRQSEVRLMDGKVTRPLDIEISTDFDKRHARLEIQTPDGWKTLSTAPLRTRLAANDPLRWPIRAHVGNCPEACKPDERHKVTFTAHFSDGTTQRVDSPLGVEIIPQPWYICWKTEIGITLGSILSGIIAYGFISPFRFGRRAGVQMSPAEDLAEGFFFPFRAARGSRAGFFRHARLFMTEDFRINGRKTGGFVRLRASGATVRIRPENGRSVWRQQADGSWDSLNPNQETIARPGVLYRNDQRSLFFDIRTK